MGQQSAARVLVREYSDDDIKVALREYGQELEGNQLHAWLESLVGQVEGAEQALDHFHALFDRAWYAERDLRELATIRDSAERSLRELLASRDAAEITLQGSARLRELPPIPISTGRAAG